MSNDQRSDGDLQETLRKAAYYKWEAAGRPEGDGLDFWLDAEREYSASNDHSELPEKQDQDVRALAVATA